MSDKALSRDANEGNLATVVKNVFSEIYQKGKLTPRSAQVEMAEYIADSLCRGKIAVAEGGTGIGKSYASLVGALVAKQCIQAELDDNGDERSMPPIVYSTGTIALQEQLAEKDLPFLVRHFSTGIEFGIAKGRGRYFCPHRADANAGDNKTMSLFGDSDGSVLLGGESSKVVSELLEKFTSSGWNGDLDAFEGKLHHHIVGAVTTNTSACLKSKCSYYSSCPFFEARRNLKSCDVIVVNHDLLLCDIALGGGRILPGKIEDTLYLIDESHHFPEKAVNHLGSRFSLIGVESRMENLSKSINRALGSAIMSDGLSDGLRNTNSAVNSLRKEIGKVSGIFNANSHLFDGGVWCFETVPKVFSDPLSDLYGVAGRVYHVLEKMMDAIKDKAELEKLFVDMSFHGSQVKTVLDTVRRILSQDEGEKPPTARWFEQDAEIQSINAFPTFASHILADVFWSKAAGVACFSATLRSLGRFDKFMGDSGINLVNRCSPPLYASSPFDYEKSGLFLLADGPSPNSKNEKEQQLYLEIIGKSVVKSKTNHGTLVIFTSRSSMNDTFDYISNACPDVATLILRQGDMSRTELIREHKHRVKDGRRSIIFGLASFREGVDLPGNLCSLVIIPRIPFAVPTTPMEKARVKWIEKQGGNSFMDYSLPACSINLTQVVGRLIRTESDVGRIIILDNRVIKARYGKLLLDNLPPFRVSHFSHHVLFD